MPTPNPTDQMTMWEVFAGIVQVGYILCCYNQDTPQRNDINKVDVDISIIYQSKDRNFKKAQQLCATVLSWPSFPLSCCSAVSQGVVSGFTFKSASHPLCSPAYQDTEREKLKGKLLFFLFGPYLLMYTLCTLNFSYGPNVHPQVN